MLQRTAKSCGPDAPTLASSSRMLCRPNRARTQHKFANDGGKKARSPGRARRKPLKPLRAGMPGDSGVLVYLCAFYYTKRTRGCGCSGHPAFPTPSSGGREINATSGASRRENKVVCRTLSTSLRGAKRRSNPFFLFAATWIASRSLSSGAPSRDPLARNDGIKTVVATPSAVIARESGRSSIPRRQW
jgi:hypothetical protein